MKFIVFFVLMVLISNSYCGGGGKKKKQASKPISPKDDDFEWDHLDQLAKEIDPIRQSFSYEYLPPKDVYEKYLHSALEYAYSIVSGQELYIQQLIYDKSAFLLELTPSNNENLDDNDVLEAIHNKAHVVSKLGKMMSVIGQPPVIWAFLYKQLQVINSSDSPSLVVYELVAEVYRYVSVSKAVIKESLAMIVRIFSSLTHDLKVLGSTSDADYALQMKLLEESQSVSKDLQEKLPILSKHLGDDHDLISQLNKLTDSMGQFTEPLQKAKTAHENVVKLQTFLVSIADTVKNVGKKLVVLDLTKAEGVEDRVEEATATMRKIFDEVDPKHMSQFENLINAIDQTLLAIRLYLKLFPLVKENKKFLKAIKEIEEQQENGSKDKSIGRDTAKKTTKLIKTTTASGLADKFEETMRQYTFLSPSHRTTSARFKIDILMRTYTDLAVKSKFAKALLTIAHEESLDHIHTAFIDFHHTVHLKSIESIVLYDLEDQSIRQDYIDKLNPSLDFSKEIKEIVEEKTLNRVVDDEDVDVETGEKNDEIGASKKETLVDKLARLKEKKKKGEWYIHKNKMCDNLDSYKFGRFVYSSPGFFYEPKFDETGEFVGHVPRKELILKRKQFEILCKINSATGAVNLRWTDVEMIFKIFYGRIVFNNGSENNVFIPTKWSHPTSFHKNHGTRLERNVASRLSALLRKWGIQIGRFKFVPNK